LAVNLPLKPFQFYGFLMKYRYSPCLISLLVLNFLLTFLRRFPPPFSVENYNQFFFFLRPFPPPPDVLISAIAPPSCRSFMDTLISMPTFPPRHVFSNFLIFPDPPLMSTFLQMVGIFQTRSPILPRHKRNFPRGPFCM